VGIVQLIAHEAGKSILCHEGGDTLFPNDWGGLLLIYHDVIFIWQAMAIVLIQFGRQRGVRSTGVLFIYWILQFVSAVLALQAHARKVAAGVINCVFYSS